jgi:hypothetical protein
MLKNSIERKFILHTLFRVRGELLVKYLGLALRLYFNNDEQLYDDLDLIENELDLVCNIIKMS